MTWQRRVQIFGAYDEPALRAHRAVLIDRRELGDYLSSRDEFERLAEQFTDSLGERDPLTVETYRKLAVSQRKAGDFSRAPAISEDTSQRYAVAFVEDHPDTLAAA